LFVESSSRLRLRETIDVEGQLSIS
jgi:hypothetical protein